MGKKSFVITPKGLDELHAFSQDEYRACRAIHEQMCIADQMRVKAEGTGFLTLFSVLFFFTFLLVGLLLPGGQHGGGGDNGISFMLSMVDQAMEGIAVVLISTLVLLTLFPVALVVGNMFGRKIFHRRISEAYTALAASATEHRPHTIRAMDWLGANDPKLAADTVKWLTRFGHITPGNALHGVAKTTSTVT